jgi:exodeoxyribonuclease VII large subunit
VTALTGAAVQDMLTVLRLRWPSAGVVVSPVRVQGKGAGADIVAALAAINRVSRVDVVIVGRGGGSVEDLWAFNEERVARAIVASRVPVVSAVGHEIDVTIADLVADCRAPTPTAAAALVVPDRQAVLQELGEAESELRVAIRRRLQRAGERVVACQRQLRDPRRVLQVVRQRVDELAERAARATAQRLRWAQQRLRAGEERLQALSPLAVLERGYSIVRRDDGQVVRAADQVQVGEGLGILLAKGRVRVRVEEREG